MLQSSAGRLPAAHFAPYLTAAYVESHDATVARCLATLLEHEAAPCHTKALALPSSLSGLGVWASALPPPAASPRIGPRGATPCLLSTPVPPLWLPDCLAPSKATESSPVRLPKEDPSTVGPWCSGGRNQSPTIDVVEEREECEDCLTAEELALKTSERSVLCAKS